MTTNDDEQRIELHEEQLRATTRTAEIGSVNVSTRVIEVPTSLEVPVESVAITTERRAVDRPAGDRTEPYEEGDALVIPVVEERLEVRRVPWIVEEVVVRQVRSTATRRVTETVRREVVDVETSGDVGRIDEPEASTR